MAVKVVHQGKKGARWVPVADPASLLQKRGAGAVRLDGEVADTDSARWSVALWSFVAHGGRVVS